MKIGFNSNRTRTKRCNYSSHLLSHIMKTQYHKCYVTNTRKRKRIEKSCQYENLIYVRAAPKHTHTHTHTKQ
jgi:hypothetical protein